MGEIIINIEGNTEVLQMIEGGYSSIGADGSCEIYKKEPNIIVYIEDGSTFEKATELYKDESGLEFAESGFYTFDGLIRYWDNDFGIFKETKTCS